MASSDAQPKKRISPREKGRLF